MQPLPVWGRRVWPAAGPRWARKVLPEVCVAACGPEGHACLLEPLTLGGGYQPDTRAEHRTRPQIPPGDRGPEPRRQGPQSWFEPHVCVRRPWADTLHLEDRRETTLGSHHAREDETRADRTPGNYEMTLLSSPNTPCAPPGAVAEEDEARRTSPGLQGQGGHGPARSPAPRPSRGPGSNQEAVIRERRPAAWSQGD